MRYSTDFEKDLDNLGYTQDEALNILSLLRVSAEVQDNYTDEEDYE